MHKDNPVRNVWLIARLAHVFQDWPSYPQLIRAKKWLYTQCYLKSNVLK